MFVHSHVETAGSLVRACGYHLRGRGGHSQTGGKWRMLQHRTRTLRAVALAGGMQYTALASVDSTVCNVGH